MANIFHIVNGDAIIPLLEKSGIGGEIVVWREMLCEGPLAIEVASDEFWEKRYKFFEENFGIAKLDYFDKTIKEILKVNNFPLNAEVVMWFEFDLFCQINLMALCSYLLQNFRKGITYNLICTGLVKGKEKLQFLTDFTSEDFKILYENKLKLSKNNLVFAKTCWNIFVENDIEKIAKFNFSKKAKFQYFQLAMNEHLKRFPNENGFNQIDCKILEIINIKALSKNEIIRNLLIWQQQETVYGFGDLQYLLYLKKLNNCYTINTKKYYLNDTGKAIVN